MHPPEHAHTLRHPAGTSCAGLPLEGMSSEDEIVDNDTPTPPDGLVGRRPSPQPRRKRRLVLLFLAVLALSTGVVLSIRYGRPQPATQFAISYGPVAIELSGPATLDATRKASISARAQGRLTEIYVDRNDSVTQGSLIATIASEDIANQLAAAVATRNAAAHAVAQARADKGRSEAVLANAESTHERKSALLRQGWLTRADYDAASANWRQAQAELARANAAIAAAQAQQHATAATVQVVEAQFQETIVRAPFDGIVVSRDRNQGDLATPGAPIVQLVDPATAVLIARFDESAMAVIHPGQAASLRFVSAPDNAITGRVLRLGRQVDTETREFAVDIVPDELPPNWAIGQRGTAVVVVTTLPRVLVAPDQAIVRRDGKPGVWLVVDGRARWRAVELGRAGSRVVEIRSGIADGATILAPNGVYEWMRIGNADVTE